MCIGKRIQSVCAMLMHIYIRAASSTRNEARLMLKQNDCYFLPGYVEALNIASGVPVPGVLSWLSLNCHHIHCFIDTVDTVNLRFMNPLKASSGTAQMHASWHTECRCSEPSKSVGLI